MKPNKCKANKKTIYRVIALLPLVLFARETWAITCTVNTSSVTINAGTFTVQRDAAIGSTISGTITGNNNKIVTCNTNYQTLGGVGLRAVTGLNSNTPSYNGNGVYNTTVSGVGTLIGTAATVGPGLCSSSGTGYITSTQNWMYAGGCGSPNSNTNFTIYEQNLFQLIKTASPLASGLINMKIAEFFPTRTANFNAIPIYLTATVNALACSVSTPNVSVTLPTVNVGSFTGVGNTLGGTPFTIGLQCDANARINATLNFSQDSDTTDQSVAAVTGKGSAGVASGVGIQLLYGSTPLKNNTMTLLKTSSGGLELPAGAFSARYFQTKSTVQAGTANTTATMTLTYQ